MNPMICLLCHEVTENTNAIQTSVGDKSDNIV